MRQQPKAGFLWILLSEGEKRERERESKVCECEGVCGREWQDQEGSHLASSKRFGHSLLGRVEWRGGGWCRGRRQGDSDFALRVPDETSYPCVRVEVNPRVPCVPVLVFVCLLLFLIFVEASILTSITPPSPPLLSLTLTPTSRVGQIYEELWNQARRCWGPSMVKGRREEGSWGPARLRRGAGTGGCVCVCVCWACGRDIVRGKQGVSVGASVAITHKTAVTKRKKRVR